MDRLGASERLHEAVAKIGGPEMSQFDEFAQLFSMRKVKKGGFFLRSGETSTKLWFLADGVVRMFYRGRDGREFNKAFPHHGDFVAALDSLITKQPARVSIEALSDCVALEAPYEKILSLYERSPSWERFGRLVAERLYVIKVKREAALLMDSAAARYEQFLEDLSDVAETIPNYHVASYLGIQPETLSRVRAARSKKSSREVGNTSELTDSRSPSRSYS